MLTTAAYRLFRRMHLRLNRRPVKVRHTYPACAYDYKNLFSSSLQEQALHKYWSMLTEYAKGKRRAQNTQHLNCPLAGCPWGISLRACGVDSVVAKILQHLGQNHLGKTITVVWTLLRKVYEMLWVKILSRGKLIPCTSLADSWDIHLRSGVNRELKTCSKIHPRVSLKETKSRPATWSIQIYKMLFCRNHEELLSKACLNLSLLMDLMSNSCNCCDWHSSPVSYHVLSKFGLGAQKDPGLY